MMPEMLNETDEWEEPVIPPFTFKENILTTCLGAFFFSFASAGLAIAAWLKINDNFFLIIPALALTVFSLFLLSFIYNNYVKALTVNVTQREITASSIKNGKVNIEWEDLQDIREEQTRLEKVRNFAPLVEVMISMYFHIPGLTTGERRSTLVFESREGQVIRLRQQLVYPHRMQQLRYAISRYAPPLYKVPN